jgi:hypothetical protein
VSVPTINRARAIRKHGGEPIHRQVVLVRPVIDVRDVQVVGLLPLHRQVVVVSPVMLV